MKVITAVPTAIARKVTVIRNLWRNHPDATSRSEKVAWSGLVIGVMLFIRRSLLKGLKD
jgi:hypothetical protein